MSITDELREWWVRKFPVMDKELHKDFTAIADRIDAEHEEALSNVYTDKMDASGWIPLPKDADNVPWNPGDRDEDGNVVTELRLTLDGWFVITDGEWPYRPESKRHHHAPTVEDVLTEFGIDWEHESDCEDRAALLKEYAKRLRLAKEDE